MLASCTMPALRLTHPPSTVQQQAGGATAQLRRFILSLGECEFAVSGVLDELQRDAFTTVADHRPARCTGTALQVRSQSSRALSNSMVFLRERSYSLPAATAPWQRRQERAFYGRLASQASLVVFSF